MVDKMIDNEGRKIRKSERYSGLRKMIGSRMKASVDKAPQSMVSTTMDMSQLAAYKKKLAEEGHKVTYTDLLIKLLSVALQKCPQINSGLVDGKLNYYESVNIGLAVGTAQGLYVPVIREVQDKTLFEISAEVKKIGTDLKNGIVDASTLVGNTFTFSNLGMYDIEYTVPIINVPDSAILCVGTTKLMPVVDENGEIVAKPMAVFSLGLDHSVLDGVPTAEFLMTIRDLLKDPENYINK